MAGLEKYEASEEWKNKFKKLLFMERKTVLKTSQVIKETQRYSMDISSDLQNILKEKNIPFPKETPKSNTFSKSDKENHFVNLDLPKNRVHFQDLQQSAVDNTILDSPGPSNKKINISDESFEAMEKMCDKTGSDPDSTLFQYLNSQNKREVIEATKKRLSAIESSTQENDLKETGIDQLLNQFPQTDGTNCADESSLKNMEMTQIEDIEAPSRFWDSTMLQTSPVKMVGLLRPSTIMEEGADDSFDDISSEHASFKTALKTTASEISSSCYQTASETASYYNPSKSSHVSVENSSYEKGSLFSETKEVKNVNESHDLIDLEKTIAVSNVSVIHLHKEAQISNVKKLKNEDEANESSPESDESIIELLSEEEDPLSPFCNYNKNVENIAMTPSTEKQMSLIKWDTPLVLKKENTSTSFNDSLTNTENSTNDSPESKNNSLHFNDTLEEVEYMMKKGMEMMAADNANHISPTITKNPLTPNILKEKQNTFTISPAKGRDDLKTPNRCFQTLSHKPSPKRTPGTKSAERFALDIKPMPKFELFKKPTSTCKAGSSASRHKDLFAHVVSPIGTYMKKTATTPLMTTMKTISDDCNSTAFRELEYESRQYQPKFNIHDSQGIVKLSKSPNARTLPKKAYISSEFRKITDERSPVTIPGGKKIQKYLDAAVIPAVIRHDGKTKMTNCTSRLPVKLQITGENSNTPKGKDNKDISLANLSVMSGDVSVYTIKDAQKL